jgi:hypothetical protein
MLLHGADADPQAAGNLGVAEPVKTMHEEYFSCAGVGPVERLPHPHQTLLGGENLIRRGVKIGQFEILDRLALVTIEPGVTMVIDREIERGTREKRFLVLDLATLMGIGMQAQHRLLHQVFGLLWRGATPAQQPLQAAHLLQQHIHMKPPL